MAIRCKFDRGKTTNRCLRGSWHSRCYGGALRKNFGAAWSPVVWQRVTGVRPGSLFSSHYRNRAKELLTNKKSKAKPDVKARAYKRKQVSSQQASSKKARREYGKDSLQDTEDVSGDQLKKLCDEYMDTEITGSNIKEIEIKTQQQSFSSIWTEERRKRITSSNFGDVVRRNVSSKVAPLVKRLLYSNFSGNRYTRRGLQQESVSIKEYVRLKGDVTVTSGGLVIDPENPHLGASPDGYVQTDSEKGIIEIKNLLQNNQLSFEDAAKKSSFCLELCGELKLKRNHNYYFQCQGLANICNVPWVDFVVRRTNPYQIHIERIYRDEDLWQSVMLPKLSAFYVKCLLPELASPRIKTVAGPREPDKPWVSSSVYIYVCTSLLHIKWVLLVKQTIGHNTTLRSYS